MSGINSKAYCTACNRVVMHKLGSEIICLNCGMESTREEFNFNREKKRNNHSHDYIHNENKDGNGEENNHAIKNKPKLSINQLGLYAFIGIIGVILYNLFISPLFDTSQGGTGLFDFLLFVGVILFSFLATIFVIVLILYVIKYIFSD